MNWNTRNSKAHDRLRTRRWRNVAICALVISLYSMVVLRMNSTLEGSAFFTGYTLIGTLFFLAAFNLRKKITFLPQLGSSAFWMQLHIYVGLATFLIFAFHINLSVPQGGFERLLGGVYLFVAGSGIYGLYITRSIPRKLTQLPTEPLFEAIPSMRNRISRQAEAIVEASSATTNVLRSLYFKRLVNYFNKSRGLSYALAPSARHSRQLVDEIEKQDRFLSGEERKLGKQLAQLVRERDDLDYHYAMQGRLKCWLIIHVGFTYSLLILSVLHGIMAHAFSGGVR